MPLCPSCKKEVGKDNIRKEKIAGITAGTWIWYCPYCDVILGMTQITSY